MGPSSKTFGTCPLCGFYGPLTQQHIRQISELNDSRIMICRSCHDIVTRYEDEVGKLKRHVAKES